MTRQTDSPRSYPGDGDLEPGIGQLLDALRRELPMLLEPNLVGVYVYGSLTQDAFEPSRSDIDALVVLERDTGRDQFERLRNWLKVSASENAWFNRLQMQGLLRDRLFGTDERGWLYQHGELRRSGSDGNPIVWQNVLESGWILAGPPAGRLLPRIDWEMLLAALHRELGYLRAEISLKPDSEWRDQPYYQSYAVLTTCRILYTFDCGRIVSKPTAATWALEVLPQRWHSLVRDALAFDPAAPVPISVQAIEELLTYAEDSLLASEP